MGRSDGRGRERGPKGGKDEGCCAGTLDTLTHPCCCGGVWGQAAVLLAVLRPSLAVAGHGTDPAAPPPAGRTAAAMYRAVRHYRVAVSPTRPACCPYTPTCSTYAVRALHRHGALRGGRLILARLLRCRPGAARRRGFHDPVPPAHRAGPRRA
ncbi:membrane protein insertion efficiency factor YidD [Streptomyces sp. DSM 41921]|uniref:Membrane protein insertion efficiency factor YidD n=1 Tax=Streptomyces dubilierae TaxID=3075533 RepID=A0ABU2PGU9_9ACTN|nr:membrane protein insertion efficiency factor YidD [Streptomyces sp. DSM 41921]MDT0391066.1 membrane protein insertion efficiency factor YidD [Streptomyces sp. DSM 41921]